METGKMFVWKGHDEEKMQKRVVQLCTLTKILSEIRFLSVNWAIPEKKWGLRTCYFEKKLPKFLGFLFHPWKFWTKHSYSTLKSPPKLYDTYWEWSPILFDFFYCPWKFYLFLVFPQKSTHCISSIFLENTSPGIANLMTSLEQTNYW